MSRPAPRRATVRASVLVAVVAVLGGCGSTGDEAPPSAAVSTSTDVSLAARANGSGEGCLLEPGAVRSALGTAVSESGPMAGRAADDGSGDYYVSWRGCTYRTADGTEVAVAELVDGEEPAVTGFDRLAHRAAANAGASGGSGAPGPRAVAGIGDQAVRDGGRLFVRVGDRAAVAEGESEAGRPLPEPTVEALAAAAADALR